MVSSSSDAASEAQVIPPPTWNDTSPAPPSGRRWTMVRMRMLNTARSMASMKPSDPVKNPRPSPSNSAMASMLRSFGAPVMDPPGKSAATTSAARQPGRTVAETSVTRWWSPRYDSSRGNGPTSTPPGTAIRPRSFRSRSTIMASSARSFWLVRSRSRWTRSSASSAPRAIVPLIGRVRALRSGVPAASSSRSSSGLEESTAPSAPSGKRNPRNPM